MKMKNPIPENTIASVETVEVVSGESDEGVEVDGFVGVVGAFVGVVGAFVGVVAAFVGVVSLAEAGLLI